MNLNPRVENMVNVIKLHFGDGKQTIKKDKKNDEKYMFTNVTQNKY